MSDPTHIDLRPMIQRRIDDAICMMDKAVDDAVKVQLVLMGWVPPPDAPCDHTIGLRFNYEATDVWTLSELQESHPHTVEEIRGEVRRTRLNAARTATQVRGTYADLVAGIEAEVAALSPLQLFKEACKPFDHCPDCGASLASLWTPQMPEGKGDGNDEG